MNKGGENVDLHSRKPEVIGINCPVTSKTSSLANMTAKRKLFKRILASANNVRFGELTTIANAFGFRLVRVSGSHHIFSHRDVPGMLNLQDVDGKAKPYQVKQFLDFIERNNLQMDDTP